MVGRDLDPIRTDRADQVRVPATERRHSDTGSHRYSNCLEQGWVHHIVCHRGADRTLDGKVRVLLERSTSRLDGSDARSM